MQWDIPQRTTESYDVFISYKTRRYANEAELLAQHLIQLGYKVWFDKYVLDNRNIYGKHYPNAELIEILKHAVRASKCSVIFEAELERIQVAYLKANMSSNAVTDSRIHTGSKLAWSWQKLEIDNSSKTIEIYVSSMRVGVHDGEKNITQQIGFGVNTYVDTTELFKMILQAVEYFGIRPSVNEPK